MHDETFSRSRRLRAAVVLLAAGEGRRVGAGTNKVLLPLSGVPVFVWSLRWTEALEYVDRVVVVTREQDCESVEALLAEQHPKLGVTVVAGGSTRHGSEWNALRVLADAVDRGDVDVVAIHDTARPFADTGLFRAVIDAAAENGGALPVREQPSLVPRDAGSTGPGRPAGRAGASTDGMTGAETLVAVQTPQAFRAGPLLEAYRLAERDGFVGTDTASCVERYTDLEIHCVPSPATNLKITFPEDVAVAERLVHKDFPHLRG